MEEFHKIVKKIMGDAYQNLYLLKFNIWKLLVYHLETKCFYWSLYFVSWTS